LEKLLQIRKFLKIFIILSLANFAFAEDSELSTCLELKGFSLEKDFGEIECLGQYHHYNSDATSSYYSYSEARKKKGIKIGSFNLYQSGSSRTEYKDYSVIAKIINNFDIVGAVELVSIIGVYKSHNEALVEYYKQELSNFQNAVSEGDEQKKFELSNKLKFIKEQYELPGYVKILKELRDLDPSWALLLTPNEEGSENATIKELGGFFYRSRFVKPVVNEYCAAAYSLGSESYACYPKFDTSFYGKDVADLVSRRPFMASFRSGSFDFTSLAVHTIYNAPSDEEFRKRLTLAAFGVENYSEVEGLKYDTYARFAELTHIIGFTEKLRKSFSEKDIIIMGDFNLESDEAYWKKLFSSNNKLDLKIHEPTSLALSRFKSDGSESGGTSRNFDHFIIDKEFSVECEGKDSAKVFNFLEGEIRNIIDSKFLVRSDESYTDQETDLVMYKKAAGADQIMLDLEANYVERISEMYTVKRGEVVKRFDIDEKLEDFRRKLFEPQLFERSYYRYMQETISDHIPVSLSCSNTFDRD